MSHKQRCLKQVRLVWDKQWFGSTCCAVVLSKENQFKLGRKQLA